MNGHSLRVRLRVVGFIVVTAIVAATGMILEVQRLASIEAFRIATVNLGHGMAQQTTQPLAALDQALQDIQTALASSPGMNATAIASATGVKSAGDMLAEWQKRLSSVESLMLIDALGKTVAASKGWPSAGPRLAAQDCFRHFSEHDDRGLFVGTPVADEVSGRTTVPMARRLEDPLGAFAGVVVANLSIDDLQAFYKLAMPLKRAIYLLRRDGVILLRYPARASEIGKKIPAGSPWYDIVAEGGGTYHAAEFFSPAAVIDAVQPLPNLPLVVEASVGETDALAEWYQERVWVVISGISAAICAVLLLRVFAHQYHRLESSEQSLAAKNTELDVAHHQLDVTLANLSQGVCFFSADMKLLVRNRRFCELFDLPEDAVRPGMSLADIQVLRLAAGSFFHDTVEASHASMEAIVRAGKPVDMVKELANGRTISGHFEPLPDRGWVVTYEDITERRAAEAKIAFLARHDVLTGLANRALFKERLDQALALAERGRGFALLCLDLDRFKAVNDTLGHPVGDALLCAVAERLLDLVRDSDTVARLGGDEFAILLLDATEVVEITAVARRIVETICDPFELSGHQVSIGTSIGIAMAPDDSSHPVELMKNADLALYRAKQEGRQTWRFFEPAMDVVASKRRSLEIDLRQAVQSGQLELRYQPVISMPDRLLTGFEALLRWRHPSRGLMAPSEFLPVAEEVGLIAEIGPWVLQRACAEAMSWPDHLGIAVNLSTRQFRGRTLVGTVADAIEASGIAAGRLELEITEAVPLRDDKASMTTLNDLRALGVRIALDDFGTGPSSLSYLRAFSFDTVKIDRSFISDLLTSNKNIALIRGIIGLTANLGMSVTAEGVETGAQAAFLADVGCAAMQGFLISRPVDAAEVPALIRRLSGGGVPAATAFDSAVTASLVG